MVKFFATEFLEIKKSITDLNKNLAIILLSIPVIATISWYFASRTFFKENLYQLFLDQDVNLDLVEMLFWLVSDSITCLILPVIILLILKEKLPDYGFRGIKNEIGIKYTIFSIIIIIPLIWFISSFDQFINYYPTISESKNNFSIFLIFNLGLLIYVFSWEFLWRGYFLFALEKKFGIYSILIQLIPFVLLHNGKPVLETFSAIVGGVILGYLALRTRTFIYGFIIHYFLMFSIEIISVLRYQNNEYGIGFNAIINILL